jgi:hypothetical protein
MPAAPRRAKSATARNQSTTEPAMMNSVFVEQREQLRDPRLPSNGSDEGDEPGHFPMPDDDSQWDVFIPDDDEIDPLPEPGDFWIEPEE